MAIVGAPFGGSLLATYLLSSPGVGAALSLFSFFVMVLYLSLYLHREHDPFPFLAGLFNYAALNFNIVAQFAVIYRKVGLLDGAGSVVREPGAAGYFSILTWAGVNYGDLRPTAAARAWVVAETLVGYIALGLLVVLVILAFERGVKRIPPKEYRKTQRADPTTPRISDIL